MLKQEEYFGNARQPQARIAADLKPIGMKNVSALDLNCQGSCGYNTILQNEIPYIPKDKSTSFGPQEKNFYK